MKFRIATLACVFAVHFVAMAEETPEVVITGSRIPASIDKLGSSVSVYTSKDIEAAQNTTVLQALEHIPGVDVVRSGGAGGNAVVFMRGANSEHTLVLLDGIELNNPASPNRAFNFADLTLENVERIEVIRGPQSTMYGSDAMGGVINIITKKGGDPAFSVSSEAGSYDSFIEQMSASGSVGDSHGSLAVTRKDVGSFSAASERYGSTEDDGYGLTSLSGKAGTKIIEELEFNAVTRYSSSDADIDNGGGLGQDDPNRRLNNEEFFVRGEATTHFLDNSLSQIAGVSFSDHDLSDDNDPDDLHPLDILRSDYEGSLLKFDFSNTWKASDNVTVVAGLETEEERATSKYFSDGSFGPYQDDLAPTDTRTNGYFTEARLSAEDMYFLNAGIRVDDHSTFGSETTWRVSPAILMEDWGTTIRSSVGTGFKAPSLVQLYSSFGNRDLQPEESIGWDIGVDQEIVPELLSASLTYFHNAFDNLVTFNSSTFILENIAQSNTQGFEAAFTAKPTEWATVRTTYTYTETEDESTGLSLLRRPRNKYGVDLTVEPCDDFGVSVFVRGVGGAFDNDFSTFTPERTRLGGYVTTNVAATYKLTKEIDLFARVENLFDKEYEEVLGFGTPGVSGFGGVRVSL